MCSILPTFLIVTNSVIFAQGVELPIGSVRLALGSEQSVVMKELKSRYFIVTVSGQPETYFVSDGKPPNVKVIGGVAFINGRLTWIQRSWGTFAGKVTSTEVTKALFSALESAASSSSSAAVIETKVQRVPGAEFKTIYFQFSGRKVTLSITDGDASLGGQQVTIEESVQLEQR